MAMMHSGKIVASLSKAAKQESTVRMIQICPYYITLLEPKIIWKKKKKRRWVFSPKTIQ